MDKFLKVCLAVASISIVLGIIIVAGVALSGKGREVIDVMEDGGVYWGENGFSVGSTVVLGDVEITEENGKEFVYPADEFDNLDIELAAGTFNIMEADVDEITIRSTKDVKVSVKGDTLHVETPKRAHVVSVGNKDVQKVEITLPKGQEFHTIDLQVGAGILVADAVKADKLQLELGAGTAEITNCFCETAEINMAAGEVVVKNGAVEKLDLDVAMGELYYAGSVSDELDADCGMGDMEIELPGESSDYNYTVDCGMGDINVGDSSYGGVATSKKVDNDADIDLDLDCGMGKIEVVFNR